MRIASLRQRRDKPQKVNFGGIHLQETVDLLTVETPDCNEDPKVEFLLPQVADI